jgi:serine phosphatase RsbU (regulator of sigma subunit)
MLAPIAYLEAVGPWMCISDNIQENLHEGSGKLEPGDLLVFHSDGTVDAGASQRNAYGLDRGAQPVERLRHQPAQVMCGEILRECRGWAPGPQQDDMSIVVVRRL